MCHFCDFLVSQCKHCTSSCFCTCSPAACIYSNAAAAATLPATAATLAADLLLTAAACLRVGTTACFIGEACLGCGWDDTCGTQAFCLWREGGTAQSALHLVINKRSMCLHVCTGMGWTSKTSHSSDTFLSGPHLHLPIQFAEELLCMASDLYCSLGTNMLCKAAMCQVGSIGTTS